MTTTAIPAVFAPVRTFFSRLIASEGPTPAGVDWPDTARQTIRFRELCRLFPLGKEEFSVLDYGCGYGALLPYLQANGFSCNYFGFDICEDMILSARRLHPGSEKRFQAALDPTQQFDFVVLSGALSLKLAADPRAWEEEIWRIIDTMDRLSTKGFGFNLLSAWREPDRKKDFLYYGDPAEFLRKMWRYSPNVAVLHDYDLWDFTVLVRKEPLYIKTPEGHWLRK